MGTSLIVNTDGGHEKIASSSNDNVPGPGTYTAKNT